MTATPGSLAAVRRPRHQGRRRARAVLAAALAALGLVVLAGCMKVEMNFTLSEDDTASGTVIMAISDAVAESLDMDPQEMWDMANEGEDGLTSDLPEGATQEPYADGEYTGVEVTYADQPIDTIGTSEDLSITREGDEYVVAGVMDLTDESTEETGEIPAEFLDSFLMRIAVTFPGEVGETNGTVDGSTVTWEPAFGERTEIAARGSAVADGTMADPTASPEDEATGGAGGSDDEATAGSDGTTTDGAEEMSSTDDSFPWWALVIAIVVGLAVLGLVVTLILRNNRPAAQAESSNPQDVFGQQTTPPSVQPGQPPVDPYHPGGPPPPPQDPR